MSARPIPLPLGGPCTCVVGHVGAPRTGDAAEEHADDCAAAEGPLRAFLEAVGISGAELARRLGRAQPSIAGGVRRGGGIGLDTLAACVEGAGYVLELRARRIEDEP